MLYLSLEVTMHARILVVRRDELQHPLPSDDAEAADVIVIQPMESDDAALQDILDRVHGALNGDGLDQVVLGDITVDFRRRRVVAANRSIRLTTQEFELLRYLAARPNTVVSRDELLRDVWKYASMPLTRSVDNAVARLRKKIEPCVQKPMFLHTVHRDGYCLMPGPATT
jgi:two-component system, OmpR family, KDP operon response regulator KdpE